jgi:hypothetical protein
MLHLFNKVYLEFDDRINLNYDRIVVSEKYGVPMLEDLEKITYGSLLGFAKCWSSYHKQTSFEEMICLLKQHSEHTKKKIFIYCDRKSYMKFSATWLNVMMPELDYETYRVITNLMVYRERCVANTQLSSQNSIDISPIFDEFREAEWEEAWVDRLHGQISPALMGVSLSYEFLLANYLGGDRNYTEDLLKTSHMFLRRFFQELFTDNRQMVLLNINNHRMQTALGYNTVEIDYTEDPLKQIPFFKYYCDPVIWKTPTTLSSGLYGICDLNGIDQKRIDGLRNTLLSVYEKFEGMVTNTTVFESLNLLEIACRDSMTVRELNKIIDKISAEPFDTCLIPRLDYENVNFPLYLHILRSYHEGKISHLKKFTIHKIQ